MTSNEWGKAATEALLFAAERWPELIEIQGEIE